MDGPSTFIRNTNRTPIDGIWATPGIDIISGGYFAYDEVFPGTEHRCIWIDLSFATALGHNMPPIVRPQMRRLHCRDPRLVENFNSKLHKLYLKHNMLPRIIELEKAVTYPITRELADRYEELDNLRCRCVAEAERKCRKLRAGQVAFSPHLQQARRNIAAWRLLLRRQKGLKVSSRLLDRSIAKSNIASQAKNFSVDDLSSALTEAYRAYYEIKRNHSDIRQTALDTLAEVLASKGNFDKVTMLKVLRHRESQRQSARKLRYLRGKINTGSTTMVSIPDGPDQWRDITEKKAIEHAILANNQEKFSQSFHTPFYQPPLTREFGFLSLTPSAQAVLDGFYEAPPNTPLHILDLLIELQTPDGIKDVGRISPCIDLQGYRAFWRKANEKVSCYPSSLSFSSMKAGAFHDYISEVDCRLTRIPLISGYAPLRWRKCLDVMILKKAGVTHLSSLRTIVLFPVDCNFAFKYVGREMMKNAEKGNALAPEQYGSRKHHRSIDLAVNKALTFDLLRQLKKPGGLCSNDAKSCYDLIGHPQASLAMQRCGVPKSIIKCLFSQLQNATHQVRTGYGDSSSCYGGSNWAKPYHGIGQGNGAGAAIWAVISSPLLNLLRKKGFHCHFVAPLSSIDIKFSGYSFVDDNDLVIVKLSGGIYEEIITALQESVDTWERGLNATSGAIIPEKTFWFLIDFAWKAGQWRYKSIDESPGKLYANDIHGNRVSLRRYEAHEAQETLGVFLAPDGNHREQIAKIYGSHKNGQMLCVLAVFLVPTFALASYPRFGKPYYTPCQP